MVKIIEHSGMLKYEILESDILPFLKKEIENEYKAAKKKWAEDRDAWKNQHGKTIPFVRPEPIKPSIKVVARGIASRSEAKIELETLKSKGPFCVVQVVVGKVKEQPEVILKDEVKLRTYVLEMEYFERIQEWAKEKEAFEKSNPETAYKKDLPQKPQLKIIKNSLRSLEKANAYLSKYTR